MKLNKLNNKQSWNEEKPRNDWAIGESNLSGWGMISRRSLYDARIRTPRPGLRPSSTPIDALYTALPFTRDYAYFPRSSCGQSIAPL